MVAVLFGVGVFILLKEVFAGRGLRRRSRNADRRAVLAHGPDVGLGAWLALVAVAGLTVLVGRKLGGRLLTHCQWVGGVVFAVFGVIALVQVF